MYIIRQLVIALLILLIVKESDEFWGRRRSSRRRRRFFKAIGKAIVTGVKKISEATIALTKGCCGIYPSVCRFKADFKRRKDQIATLMSSINTQWTLINKEMSWLKSVNDNNGVIYQHIQRITEKSTSAIEMLDPKIMVKLNNVTNTIKKGIQRHNSTVLQYGIKEIATEMDKTKNETGTNMEDLEVIGNEYKDNKIKKIADDMFKLMEISQVTNLLGTTDGMKLSNAQSQVAYVLTSKKVTSRNQEAITLARELVTMNPIYQKGLLIYKGAMGIIDGYNKFVDYIKDLATCKKQRSTAEKNVKDIIKEQREIFHTLNTLSKERIKLKTNHELLMNVVDNVKLLKELELIEDIAKQASSQSSMSRQAAAKIKEYREKISTTTSDEVPNMQRKLISAFTEITYTVDCYRRKLATIQTIYRNCKDGLGNPDELYRHALADFKPNDAKCRTAAGFAYTTKNDVMKLVQAKSSKEFFEKNCMVNGAKRTLTCESKNDGFTDLQLASKYKTDLRTVQIITKTCATPSLSPSAVCKLKEHRKTIDTIFQIFPSIRRDIITNAYNRCA